MGINGKTWNKLVSAPTFVGLAFLLLLPLVGVEEGTSKADLYLCYPIIFLAVIALFVSISSRSSSRFCNIDILALLLFSLSLANCLFVSGVTTSIKLTHLVMLGLLYVSLRILLPVARCAEPFILMVLLVCAIVESANGIFQALGLSISNHSLYNITGTFFNPGPFAGYLAITGSMAFAYLVDHYGEVSIKMCVTSPKTLFNGYVLLYLLCGTALILVLIVLPATMGRAAFVAFACSALAVLFRNKKTGYLFVKIKSKRTGYALTGKLLAIILVIIFVGGLSLLLYNMKKDSADGRLLIWRVTASMVAKNPVMGVGMGEFSSEYAGYQKKYFSDNPGSPFVGVAGIPDHGFNDYLQLGAEAGIPFMLLYTILLVITLLRLFSKKSVFAYGLLALAIFSFFSYPLSLLPFSTLLVVFTAVSASNNGNSVATIEKRIITAFVLIVWLVVSVLVTVFVKEKIADIRTFKSVSYLYRVGLYGDAIKEYLPLLPNMYDDKKFLFELGHSYNKVGMYGESNVFMDMGTMISGDPMFLDIMGNNYKELGAYGKAALCYQEAFAQLPNRLYPLYLLMLLYESTEENDKALDMAKKIVGFDPKISTGATDEMKKYASKILIR